jgi:hypothetical protein
MSKRPSHRTVVDFSYGPIDRIRQRAAAIQIALCPQRNIDHRRTQPLEMDKLACRDLVQQLPRRELN